jgi:hypothetical protein
MGAGYRPARSLQPSSRQTCSSWSPIDRCTVGLFLKRGFWARISVGPRSFRTAQSRFFEFGFPLERCLRGRAGTNRLSGIIGAENPSLMSRSQAGGQGQHSPQPDRLPPFPAGASVLQVTERIKPQDRNGPVFGTQPLNSRLPGRDDSRRTGRGDDGSGGRNCPRGR